MAKITDWQLNDLLVCSSFKGDYAAFPGTLIGNLSKEGISVESEAEHGKLTVENQKIIGYPNRLIINSDVWAVLNY